MEPHSRVAGLPLAGGRPPRRARACDWPAAGWGRWQELCHGGAPGAAGASLARTSDRGGAAQAAAAGEVRGPGSGAAVGGQQVRAQDSGLGPHASHGSWRGTGSRTPSGPTCRMSRGCPRRRAVGPSEAAEAGCGASVSVRDRKRCWQSGDLRPLGRREISAGQQGEGGPRLRGETAKQAWAGKRSKNLSFGALGRCGAAGTVSSLQG